MFVETREIVDRLRRAEEKKARQESDAAAALLARKDLIIAEGSDVKSAGAKRPMRRSSAIITSNTSMSDLLRKSLPADQKTQIVASSNDAVSSESNFDKDNAKLAINASTTVASVPTLDDLSAKKESISAVETSSISSAAVSPKGSANNNAGNMKSAPSAAMRRKSTFS